MSCRAALLCCAVPSRAVQCSALPEQHHDDILYFAWSRCATSRYARLRRAASSYTELHCATQCQEKLHSTATQSYADLLRSATQSAAEFICAKVSQMVLIGAKPYCAGPAELRIASLRAKLSHAALH